MLVEADEEHHISFAEDRRPGNVPSNEPPLVCPDTLEEMLHIVSNVRQGRMVYCGTIKFKPLDRTWLLTNQKTQRDLCFHPIATLSMLPRQHST